MSTAGIQENGGLNGQVEDADPPGVHNHPLDQQPVAAGGAVNIQARPVDPEVVDVPAMGGVQGFLLAAVTE